MADAVTTNVLFNGNWKYAVRLTNRSDSTGETLVTKVDISTLVGPNGKPVDYTGIIEIQWTIEGFTSVQLYWDHTTDDTIDILAPPNGYRTYRDTTPLWDPRSAGGTGDILLSTFGAAANATYDITLILALRNNP